MAKKPVTLLCAASGTGLSGIARKLADRVEGAVIGDLELELCKTCQETSRLPNQLQQPSMADVIEKLPRSELYERWDQSIASLLLKQLQNKESPMHLMALHLTWYNCNTKEFFSPVDYKKLENNHFEIARVVILIDDVYDMFARLQGKGDLYSDVTLESDAMLLSKLSNRPGTEYKDLGEKEKRRLLLEAREVALAHLISWRRAEMTQAENIARALEADFTVFGVKHSWDAFTSLVGKESSKKTYLSHKISEIRRMNKATNSLPENLGTWSATTTEVNELHKVFADHRQVLINPTAIDELRFDDTSEDGHRSPLLSKRWPLPTPESELLWHPPNGEYEEHTEFLVGGLEMPDPVASSVSRSLSNKIFFDVASRDHMIVEHSDNLCVYRPFFHEDNLTKGTGAKLSGGVEPEIRHWLSKPDKQVRKTPRLAVVHTQHEIRARIRFLEEGGFHKKVFCSEVRTHLEELLQDADIPANEISLFFTGHLKAESTHLAAKPPSAIEDKAEEVLTSIKAVATASLKSLFSGVKDLKGDAVSQDPRILILVFDEKDQRRIVDLGDVGSTLCRFYAGEMDEDEIKRRNDEFANAVETALFEIVEQKSEQYVSSLLSLPLSELQNL